MRLNLHILSDILQKWDFQGVPTDPPEERFCAYPMICSEIPAQFQREILYLLPADALPERPGSLKHISILCFGKPPQAWLQGKGNVLYTQQDITPNDVINELSFQFFRYQNWEDSMQEVLDQNLPIQELANRTKGIFSNPFSVMGNPVHVICGYAPESPTKSPVYQRYRDAFSLESGYIIDPEESSDFVSDAEYEQTPKSKTPMIIHTRYGFSTLYYNLFVQDVMIACVCIDEVIAPLTQRDHALIQIWGNYIEKALKSNSAYSIYHGKEYGETFRSLIDHKLLPEQKILEFLKEYHWEMHDEYVCIVMKHKVDDITAALEPLAISLSNLTRNACYVIKDSRLIFLYNLTRMQMTQEQLYRMLLPSLRDMLLTACISNPFFDFKNLYYYYKNTLDVSEIAQRKDPTKWYHKFEDYQLDLMLQTCREQTISEALIPTGLKRLMEHDRQKGSEFVQTLKVYLDQERNVAQTIRLLYVHRNTFSYRIEKIQQILGMDLQQPENRLTLQLALRILDGK